MNILQSLLYPKNIDILTYETEYIEQPIPDVAKFIDWKKILNSPPKNSSQTTIEELKVISKYTLNRTQQDVALVQTINSDVDSLFIELLNTYKLDYPYQTIDNWYQIIKPILLNTKSLWNRPRPYQLARYYGIPIDVIITDTHDTAAYPSGHVVYSRLAANVLSSMFPEINISQLNYIVEQTGIARIKQGVHYLSDNKASLMFTDHLYKNLKNKME